MNTLIVSSKEFRSNFPKYQELVERGVSITIVKRSKPIFVLQPIDIKFDDDVSSALLDYEKDKENKYVGYNEVFPKKK